MDSAARGWHKGEGIVPPFNGVRLIDYIEEISLTPTYACREFFGVGKVKASAIRPKNPGPLTAAIYAHWGDQEVWVALRWERYEDGSEQPTFMNVVDGTEEEAHRAVKQLMEFSEMSKEELEELGECFHQTKEDIAYIKNRFPDDPPSPNAVDAYNLFQARLRVLMGMQPRTVTLIQQAYSAEDPAKREGFEREAVQAYFAEVGQCWTEQMLKEWQRSNPVGAKWMCEFVRVLKQPERELNRTDYELVLNWLRKGYNLMTEKELADAYFKQTGHQMTPAALKKRRERLDLRTKRPPGPRPKYEP